MKKILIISLVLVGIVLISGCSNGIKTTSDLKKELAPAKAEYEKCVAEVNAYSVKFDKELSDCKKMPDGIACIGSECSLNEDGTYPAAHQECNICKNSQRYNDEVAKINKCGEDIQWDPKQLSLIDCSKLLTQ